MRSRCATSRVTIKASSCRLSVVGIDATVGRLHRRTKVSTWAECSRPGRRTCTALPAQDHLRRWQPGCAGPCRPGAWHQQTTAAPTPSYPPHPMDRAQIITTLTAHKPVLAQRFGVLKLALFGSVAAWRVARGAGHGAGHGAGGQRCGCAGRFCCAGNPRVSVWPWHLEPERLTWEACVHVTSASWTHGHCGCCRVAGTANTQALQRRIQGPGRSCLSPAWCVERGGGAGQWPERQHAQTLDARGGVC